MSDCSVDSPSACQPKPKKAGKPSSGAKAKLAAEVTKQEAKPAKKRTSKKKTTQAKPPADATTTSKEPASKKAPSKKAASKKPSAKKPSAKKKGSKLPNWRYTTFRNDRYRYREVAGELVVEREKDGAWTSATASAARAVHEKSQSACALAAQILPTCGTNKSKPSRLRPTDAQKQAMRKFLGL